MPAPAKGTVLSPSSLPTPVHPLLNTAARCYTAHSPAPVGLPPLLVRLPRKVSRTPRSQPPPAGPS